jgi:uncharacterized protein with GYD domain
MKTIQTYEQAIEDAKQGKKIEGFNYRVLRAYDQSREAGSETLNFYETILESDIPAIIEACRKEGIEAITTTANSSGLLETLAAFEAKGCRLAGLTKAPERDTHKELPAALIKMN